MTIRVLIVDDSGFFVRRLSAILSSDPLITVVGSAENGLQALELVKTLKPDVITMDIEMPVMDGITAVSKIMASNPTPILMLSSWTTDGAKATLNALDAGAIDYLSKNFDDISLDRERVRTTICKRVHKVAQSHLHGTQLSALTNSDRVLKKTSPDVLKDKIKLIVIGTSTGGPVALQKVLTQLPANFPHPVLLLQHMPAAFTPSFAERLDAQCKITVKHAQNNDVLKPATAYLAPGGMQMLLKGSYDQPFLEVQAGQVTQTYKPCIDLTLQSISQIYPKETLAIILTGMGSDGREGCRELHNSGATIWVQDELSCTIYGMPKAVFEAGLAHQAFDILDIGHHLAELA